MAMITETQSGARYSGSFTVSVTAALQAVARMLRLRMILSTLDALSDSQLQDIGLTRHDLFDLRTASAADTMGALARIRFYR